MGENPPSERVYISGLPTNLDTPKLKGILAAYGTITDAKAMGTGSAVVTFATLDESKWVVENLDGNMPEGIKDPIGVQYAKPQSGAWGKGGGGAQGDGGWSNRSSPYGGKGVDLGKGGFSIQALKTNLMQMGVLPGGRNSKERSDAQQLYVKGLPADTTDADLHDIFAPFGAIPPRGVKATLNPEGQCTGIGWVDFCTEAEAAKAARALNGTMLADGTQLKVHVKNSTKGGGSKGKA